MMSLLYKFKSDLSGQIAIVTALFSFVLILAFGGAIDITHNYSVKSKLQYAADESAIAGSAYFQMNEVNVAEVKKLVKSVFAQNCPLLDCNEPSVQIIDEAITVTFSGENDNRFLGAFGINKSLVSVLASSEIGIVSESKYVDVYFVFDISSSGMFPDTQQGVDLMEANFDPFGTGGCAFACHVDTGGGSGDQQAQMLGVNLREDRMRGEIERISDEFFAMAGERVRISLISFGANARELVSLTSLKSGIDVGLADSDYVETPNGSGTNYEAAFVDLYEFNMIPASPGEGTALNPKNIVVLITDGVYSTSPTSTSGTIADQPINPATCDIIKGTGAELFVLNLKYPNPADLLTNSSSAARMNNLETFYDQISPNMEACASTSRYFEGLYNTEIVAAFEEVYDGITEVIGKDEKEARLVR